MNSPKTTFTLLVLIVLASMYTSGRLQKIIQAMTQSNTGKATK